MGLSTFSTGISGLTANSQGLNVTGNNLANLNTVGFKSSTISFAEVLGQTYAAPNSGFMHVGLGTQVGSVRPLFTQGGPQSTSNPLDVLIQGKGFFVLSGGNGGNFYTRAGNFKLDSNGVIVGTNNLPVMGYAKDPITGVIDTSTLPKAIKLPSGLSSPLPTSTFELGMNLDSNAPAGTQFSTTFQVFDSLGAPHLATLTLQKKAPAGTPPTTDWDFDITIPNKDISGVASTNTQKFSLMTGAVAAAAPNGGSLRFNSAGQLVAAWTGATPPATPSLANLSIPPASVTWPDLGNGGRLSTVGMTWNLLGAGGSPNISGFASASTVTSTNQNGTAAGSPSGITVQSDGTITASFSSGQTIDIARMAIAIFNSPEGLVPRGSGLFSEHSSSGSPSIGAPGDGGRGLLLGGSLEGSNVDLATELTNIITFQRGYQASARIITVTDQVLQETINLRQ